MATPANPAVAAPPQSTVQTAPNLVSFDPKLAVPSQQVYFQRNDYLAFSFISNQASNNLRINYRWLTPQGEIKEGEADVTVSTVSNLVTVPIYEGWLLSFNVRLTNAPAAGSWTFVQALIFRGAPPPSTNNPTHGVFWQGFANFLASNGWPGTPAKELSDGSGTLRAIVGATPAAGAEINEVVPTNRRWTLISFRGVLTASATVANRFPGFTISDSGNNFFISHSNTAQVASQVFNYTMMPSQPFFNDTTGNIIIPVPGFIQLKAAEVIRSNTNGLQATDQWSNVEYLVIEWGLWDT